ncbi:MAG: hypothetical protein J6V65_00300, partial [Fibrobacterales bacterium]|nr:hypothetical protein [Fibrobacterales bacterium]
IPGLNTLLLAGFACMAIATERARLLWDRTHLLLLCAVVAFACANTFAVNGESRRLTGALFRTIQPALATALFLYVDLPREKILKVMKWINLLILFCTFVALVESVLRTPQRPFAIYLINSWSLYAYPTYQSAWLSMNVGNALFLFRSTGKRRYLLSALVCLVAVVLVGRRKSFVSACLVFCMFLLMDGTWKARIAKIAVGVSVGLGAILTVGRKFLSRFLAVKAYVAADAVDTQARTALHLRCIDVARDYFPWGSGLGTFASQPAFDDYSPLYYVYGLDKVRGLEPFAGRGGNHSFLLDTWWPHVVAEFGFIGTVLFLALWFYPLLGALRLPPGRTRKDTVFFIAAVWCTILLESTGATYPEQLQFILVYCGLSALLLRRAREEAKR